MSKIYTVSGYTIQTITLAEVRAEQVARYGEAKVAEWERKAAEGYARARASRPCLLDSLSNK